MGGNLHAIMHPPLLCFTVRLSALKIDILSLNVYSATTAFAVAAAVTAVAVARTCFR